MNDRELQEFANLLNVQVVIDVGARDNQTFVSVHPEAEYHMFEPNVKFYKKLVESYKNRKNIHLNNYGLGDIEGVVGYNFASQAFVDGEHLGAKTATATYPIKTLNQYLIDNNITRIDFLKIDTEGYDYKVLKGGGRAIEIAKCIQYEYWDNREEFHPLLETEFDMTYIGYRNVLCKRRQ